MLVWVILGNRVTLGTRNYILAEVLYTAQAFDDEGRGKGTLAEVAYSKYSILVLVSDGKEITVEAFSISWWL